MYLGAEGSLHLLYGLESPDYEGEIPWDHRVLAASMASDPEQGQQEEHMVWTPV